LKSIGFQKLEKEFEVIIELEGEFGYQTLEMSNPPRLVIEFLKVKKVLTRPSYDIHEFAIERIRTGQFLPLIGRVVFDFSEKIPFYKINQIEKGIKVTCWLDEDLAKKIAKAKKVEKQKERKGEEVKKKPEGLISKEELMIKKTDKTMIGLSLGSYHISSDVFHQIYGIGGPIFGLDLSHIFLTQKNLNFGLSLEARCYSKTGASTMTKEETKLSLTPLSLATRCLVQTKYLIPFFGVGLDYYHYTEKSVLQDTSGSAVGYHIQGGVYYQIPKLNFLKAKIFMKLTKAVATENDREVDLGGVEYGINLTYSFKFL